jgi:hypothetical protein
MAPNYWVIISRSSSDPPFTLEPTPFAISAALGPRQLRQSDVLLTAGKGVTYADRSVHRRHKFAKERQKEARRCRVVDSTSRSPGVADSFLQIVKPAQLRRGNVQQL